MDCHVELIRLPDPHARLVSRGVAVAGVARGVGEQEFGGFSRRENVEATCVCGAQVEKGVVRGEVSEHLLNCAA